MSLITKLLGKEDTDTTDPLLKPQRKHRRKLQKRRPGQHPRDIMCLDELTAHHAYSPPYLPPTSTGRNTSNRLISDDYESWDIQHIPDVPQKVVLNASAVHIEKNDSRNEDENLCQSGGYYDWYQPGGYYDWKAQESLEPKLSNNSYYPMEVQPKFKGLPTTDSEAMAASYRHVLSSPQETALDGYYSASEKEILLLKSQDSHQQMPDNRHPLSASSYFPNLINSYLDDSRYPPISHDDQARVYEETVYSGSVYDSVYGDSVYSESDHSLDMEQQIIHTNEPDHNRSREIDAKEFSRDDDMEAEMYLGLLTSQIATGFGRNRLTDNSENLAKWRMGLMLETLASIPKEIERRALGLPEENFRHKSDHRHHRSLYKVHESVQNEEKGIYEWI